MSLRGDDQNTNVQQRQGTTYFKSTKGEQTHQLKEQNGFNKGLGEFVLSNKFEYGYDTNGGRKFASGDNAKKSQIEKQEIITIVSNIGSNYTQCAANKANDAKQNFDIKPVGNL